MIFKFNLGNYTVQAYAYLYVLRRNITVKMLSMKRNHQLQIMRVQSVEADRIGSDTLQSKHYTRFAQVNERRRTDARVRSVRECACVCCVSISSSADERLKQITNHSKGHQSCVILSHNTETNRSQTKQ